MAGTTALNPESVVRRNAEASFEVVAGEAIVIHLTSGTYYSLDEVGTMFWEQIDGEQTLATIGASIAARFDVEPDVVTGDLIDLTQELVAEQLADVV